MKVHLLIKVLMIAGAASLTQAKIIDATCAADGDGAIVMEGWTWWWEDLESTAYMTMTETQYWAPAHVFASFIADTPEDPSALISKEVQNLTTFDWTDYHINITLDKTFTIVSVGQPVGWGLPVVTQPSEVSPGVWLGSVDYYYGGPGTEILIGGIATYDVKVSFAGTANLIIEQIPTPEPASLGLLALGALALLRRR